MSNFLEHIEQVLKTAPRMGEETDEPEGARYIQISDTLAKKLLDELADYQFEEWSRGIDNMGEDA